MEKFEESEGCIHYNNLKCSKDYYYCVWCSFKMASEALCQYNTSDYIIAEPDNEFECNLFKDNKTIKDCLLCSYFKLKKIQNHIKKAGNGRSRSIPKDVQREVWRRDMGRCTECGSKERLEFDHIIPFSKGGSNTVRNIQLLCEICNRKKSNKIGE